MTGDIKLLATDPSLEMDRFNPNANASSLSLNHTDNIALFATFIFSPPQPKIIRPKYITGQDLILNPNANTTCPIVIRHEKISKQNLAPHLSVKYPPKKGNTMLGTAYKVYRRENSVSKSSGFPKYSSICEYSAAGMS